MSESVPILKARIDELARANAVFRRQHDEIRHLDGLRRLGEQMLDCSGEAIIATDLEGKIIFWNSYAEKLYGWRSDEVLGQNVVIIVPATAAVADAENIMARLRKIFPNGLEGRSVMDCACNCGALIGSASQTICVTSCRGSAWIRCQLLPPSGVRPMRA